MGKKQHSKDRLYLTTKEWKNEFGGFKDRSNIPKSIMPFYYCSISFQPAVDPVCSVDGYVFDIVNAMKYIQRFHKHPITGQAIDVKDLVQIHFHKNSDGQIQCPILNKVLTDYSHVVAIRTTGNVYSYEAIDELCIKSKNYQDLINDQPFIKKDIIHLQDPQNLNLKKVATEFDHIKNDLQVEEAQDEEGFENFRNISDNLKEKLAAIKKAEKESGDAISRDLQTQRLAYKEMLQEEQLKGQKNSNSTNLTLAKATPNTAGQNKVEDWRLQPPTREVVTMPKFKAGASTWDTDDLATNSLLEQQKKEKNSKQQSHNNRFLARKDKEKGQEKGEGNKVVVGGGGQREKIDPEVWFQDKVVYKYGKRTTGSVSRGFTSTNLNPQTKLEFIRERVDFNPTKKSYVRLQTNLGDINVELHSDLVPRTCENFLYLCQMGYYNGLLFHRSIKSFMIQGGDPTNSGSGGSSIFGPTFPDEIDSRLVHSQRGILSMANSGKDTNGSQFYITYKSARHLDFKHSVFGQVVGGFEVLTRMEQVPTDRQDRPKQEIYIKECQIFSNPYEEMVKEYLVKQEQEKQQEGNNDIIKEDKTKNYVTVANGVKVEQDQTYGNWFSDPSHTYLQLQQKQPDHNHSRNQGSAKVETTPSLGIGKYLKTNQTLSKSQNQIQQTLGEQNIKGQINKVNKEEQLDPQKRKQDDLFFNTFNDQDILQQAPRKKQQTIQANFGNFDNF